MDDYIPTTEMLKAVGSVMSNKKLAEQLGISEQNLCNIKKKGNDLKVQPYIRLRRIYTAVKPILFSDMPESDNRRFLTVPDSSDSNKE